MSVDRGEIDIQEIKELRNKYPIIRRVGFKVIIINRLLDACEHLLLGREMRYRAYIAHPDMQKPLQTWSISKQVVLDWIVEMKKTVPVGARVQMFEQNETMISDERTTA